MDVQVKVDMEFADGSTLSKLYDAGQPCRDIKEMLQGIGKGELYRGPVTMTNAQIISSGEYKYVFTVPTLPPAPAPAPQHRRYIKGYVTSIQPDYFAERLNFIDAVLDRLPKLKWMVMKAPPAAGKTTALIQLAECGLKRGYKDVYYFNAVEARGQKFVDGFENVTRTPWRTVARSPPNSMAGVPPDSRDVSCTDLILVDESQLLYDSATEALPLWDLVKSLEGGSKQVHVVLAAIWGAHPSHGDGTAATISTPISASAAQVIQLHATTDNPLCLALSWEHFMEQVTAWRASYNAELDDTEVLQHVFDITRGYVGVISHLLTKIGNRIRTERQRSNAAVDEARAARYALTSSDTWSALSSVRSVMNDKRWHEVEEIMCQLLRLAGPRGQCTFHDRDTLDQIAHLQRLGYVHLDVTTNAACFHSPLHYWYYLYKSGSSRIPADAVAVQDLSAILIRAIQRMSASRLQASLARGQDDSLLERAYQMEFYTALYSVLPSSFMVSPDVGTVLGSEGYVDFVLHGTIGQQRVYYAVELLRDGRGTQEHAERFAQGGRYAPMLQSSSQGCVPEFALLDFRSASSRPRNPRSNFIYVCLTSDYSSGTLIVGGREQAIRLTE